MGMASDVAGADAGSDLPDIHDRLVEPGTRYEMIDGRLVYVPPCDAPHGTRQLRLCALVEAHIGSDFVAASDLLTRTSLIDDIAPDVSVYRAAPDPRTGRPRLAEIAFEVVSTQSLGDAGAKAAKLVGRGVRRVFAIDVSRSRMLEWSTSLARWSLLDAAGVIADPALEVPLPIEAMIRDARIDGAVIRALDARHSPALEEIKARSEAEGRENGFRRGKAEAVVAVLAARNLAMAPEERAQILGERDPARLDRWISRAIAYISVAELLADR